MSVGTQMCGNACRFFGLVLFATVAAGCAGASMTVAEAGSALRSVHPNDEVVITFQDGGSVRSKPHQHRWTDSVGAYQVRGTRRPRPTSRSTESYAGWISASDVDSVRTIGSVATPVSVLYLKDGSLVYAAAPDLRPIMPTGAPGFWCTGAYARSSEAEFFGSDSTFLGVVDPAAVRSVEVVDQEWRAASYLLQGLGVIAAIPLLYGAGTFLVWAWSR